MLILAGLLARSLGTVISLAGTPYSPMEKMFAVVSNLPKATVQAAIGAVPLAAGMPGGEVMLAVAVLSILFTAPLGAVAIRVVGERVLSVNTPAGPGFQELRESMGLPRVGQRLKERATGVVWKVIEERERWEEMEAEPEGVSPVIEIRVWREEEGLVPGKGPTRMLSFTSRGDPLHRHWEIVFLTAGRRSLPARRLIVRPFPGFVPQAPD